MRYIVLTGDYIKGVRLRTVYDDAQKAHDYGRKLAAIGETAHIIGCLTYDGAISQSVSIKKINISCYAKHYTFWNPNSNGYTKTAVPQVYTPLSCFMVLLACENIAENVISRENELLCEFIFNA